MLWVILAFAFAGVWVYAFYREDIRNPEPIWLVGLAVAGGMVAVPVAMWVEARLEQDPMAIYGSLASRAGLAFLVAGPVEEMAKFLAVALLIGFQSHFDEPMDGIVYAAAAAAGFALAENLLFLQDEPISILARGPAATGAHILFAAFWGGALGHAKHVARRSNRFGLISVGLVLAFAAHGLFDMITWTVDRELSLNQARLAQVSLIAGCALFLRWRIHDALRSLPLQLPIHAVVATVDTESLASSAESLEPESHHGAISR